uniref:UDP-Glc:alpha-D-GlcNAc-diphosphoundecaprenol beta-1,3-glucosyltransferase WfgD n=1 Tax=Vibrio parahaemolyticus TaxID=670 RepID=A0A7M1WQQ3_VIBPH|nr:UDP-Glc:alpha-D-GlcNAc-diphosphoundecaprenol beta-1,3-glucosyltransferase WfgD [Vibrio parahaemolyticus]
MSHVCVLMAVYNGAKYLEEQIESILEQRDVDVDLYIRLDPSNDDSKSIIRRYEAQNHNVHLILASESSGSAGQNFFNLLLEVDFESYEFVAFADQDDIWFSDKLLRATDSIIREKVAAYSGDVIAWWDSGKERLIKKSSSQVQYDYLFESAGPGCTFVFTKELANALKRFLQSLGEGVKTLWLHDWFCYAFARNNGYEWFIDDRPMMKYRQHEANSVGANSGLSAFKARIVEVLSGSALEKVCLQASVLNMNSKLPIALINQRRFHSSLKLASYACQCRRKPSDKLLFAIVMVVHAFGQL